MASDLLLFWLFPVVLTILLSGKFAKANGDCGIVYETQVDHALFGHVMKSTAVVDDFECHLKCSGNSSCLSVNVHPGTNNGKRICELNNETRLTKPGDFKKKKGSNYYGSVKTSCVDLSHDKYKQRSGDHCSPGYRGKRCQTPRVGWHSRHPALSCKDIRDKGDSRGDGKYWIDPKKSGDPLKVYCDMTTDGGWTMVFKAVSGVAKDAYEVYNSALTYSEKTMTALDVTNNYGDHYKNRIILNWNNFGPSEARVVLYKEGSMVKELKFDARGTDKFNWFRVENLTNSSWNDIKKEPAPDYFSITGDNGLAKRRFFINRNYGGCSKDNGWMVISGTQCDWEKRKQQPHGILYSKEDGYVNWDKGNVGEADVLAVYVR